MDDLKEVKSLLGLATFCFLFCAWGWYTTNRKATEYAGDLHKAEADLRYRENEVAELTEERDRFKLELRRLERRFKLPDTTRPKTAFAKEIEDGQLVILTTVDKLFHTPECDVEQREDWEFLEDAKKRGFSPCPKCGGYK